jgi:hypothetical protein
MAKEVEGYWQLGFLVCQLLDSGEISYGFIDFFRDDLINGTMNLPLPVKP